MRIFKHNITIAVDIMGADKDPQVSIEALKKITKTRRKVKFLIYGNKDLVENEDIEFLKKNGCEFYHTDKKITSQMKPSLTIRKSADTSMRLAIEAVKNKKADAVVSSGNTGSLMALSKILLKTLPGITRPALCSLMPSMKNPFVMLDLGANSEASPEQLVQFATMGVACYYSFLPLKKPRVALLNIGEEKIKGTKNIQEAHDILEKSNTGGVFVGYIEPNKALRGGAEVVVADGFTGNIAIKSMEGISSCFKEIIRNMFQSKIIFKLIYKLFLKKTIKRDFSVFDHKQYNGAAFLGLKGICIKSHGGCDSVSFSYALDMAISLSKEKMNDKIEANIKSMKNNSVKNL